MHEMPSRRSKPILSQKEIQMTADSEKVKEAIAWAERERGYLDKSGLVKSVHNINTLIEAATERDRLRGALEIHVIALKATTACIHHIIECGHCKAAINTKENLCDKHRSLTVKSILMNDAADKALSEIEGILGGETK